MLRVNCRQRSIQRRRSRCQARQQPPISLVLRRRRPQPSVSRLASQSLLLSLTSLRCLVHAHMSVERACRVCHLRSVNSVDCPSPSRSRLFMELHVSKILSTYVIDNYLTCKMCYFMHPRHARQVATCNDTARRTSDLAARVESQCTCHMHAYPTVRNSDRIRPSATCLVHPIHPPRHRLQCTQAGARVTRSVAVRDVSGTRRRRRQLRRRRTRQTRPQSTI